MNLYLGIDLGIHLAATAIDDVLCCRWQYYQKRTKEESPCESLRRLLVRAQEELYLMGDPRVEAMSNGVVVCAERAWLKPLPGKNRIDARSLFGLAEQLGYLCYWTEQLYRGSTYTVDDSAAMAKSTGIHKDCREEVMPTKINGIDRKRFLGPKGGKEALSHVADSEYLAFVAHRQVTWEQKIAGAVI